MTFFYVNHFLAVSTIVILNYLPLMMGYSYLNPNDPGKYELLSTSVDLKIALAVSAMGSMPLVWENAVKMQNLEFSSFNLFILLVIPDVYMLVIALPWHQFDFVHALHPCRDTLFVYYFIYKLSVYTPQIWGYRQWLLSLLPYVVTCLISNWSIVFQEQDVPKIQKLQYCCISLFLLDMLISFFQLFYLLRQRYGGADIFRKSSDNETAAMTTSILMFIYAMASWAQNYDPNEADSYAEVLGEGNLTVTAYLTCLVSLIFGFSMFKLRLNLFVTAEKENYVLENLIKKMLPIHAVQSLKDRGIVLPHQHEQTTIYFSDIEGFTTIASECTPYEVLKMLNGLYTVMDHVASYFPSLYKGFLIYLF